MKLLEHFKELTLHPKNAEELKGLILQLAVQGKLTRKWREEHPDVEPASVLLERIRIENNNNVHANRIKEIKQSPSLTEYEIHYDLPIGWEFCQMGDIIKISSGNGLTSSKMDKSGQIPVYGGNGITGYHSSGNVEERTIVIGRVGFYCGSIHLTEKIAWVTDNAFITRYSKENIDRDFLVWLLKGTNLKENENATAQPVISGRKVYPIIISLPPLEEQKAIVEVVNQLFAELEQLEALTNERIQLKADFVTSALNRLTQAAAQDTASQWGFLQRHFGTFFTEKSTLKKLREGILQLAVQGKLTHHWRSLRQAQGPAMESASMLLEKIKAEKEELIKAGKIKKDPSTSLRAGKPLPEITEEDIPYELPEGWVWSNILDISIKITDGEHATPKRTDSGYKLLSARNVTNEGIRLHKVDYVSEEEFLRIRKRCDPQKGDILISCSGSVGRVCLVDKDDEYCMVRSAALVKHDHNNIDGMFLCYALRSPFLQEQILEKSRSTAQSNLFLGKIKELIFPLPNLGEQKAIVEKVNSLIALCDKLEQEIEANQTTQEEWMQSCLRDAVKG